MKRTGTRKIVLEMAEEWVMIEVVRRQDGDCVIKKMRGRRRMRRRRVVVAMGDAGCSRREEVA